MTERQIMKKRTSRAPRVLQWSGWAIAALMLMVWIAAPVSVGQGVELEDKTDYRQAYLKNYARLLQVTLERDQQINEKAPGTIPEALLAAQERRVKSARAMVEAAAKNDDSSRFEVFLHLAETAAATAKSNWHRWSAVRERAPAAKSKLDLERFELQWKLAQITLDEGQSLKEASLQEQNGWKMNLMFDEVLRLNEKVDRSAQLNSYRSRLIYPIR